MLDEHARRLSERCHVARGGRVAPRRRCRSRGGRGRWTAAGSRRGRRNQRGRRRARSREASDRRCGEVESSPRDEEHECEGESGGSHGHHPSRSLPIDRLEGDRRCAHGNDAEPDRDHGGPGEAQRDASAQTRDHHCVRQAGPPSHPADEHEGRDQGNADDKRELVGRSQGSRRAWPLHSSRSECRRDEQLRGPVVLDHPVPTEERALDESEDRHTGQPQNDGEREAPRRNVSGPEDEVEPNGKEQQAGLVK